MNGYTIGRKRAILVGLLSVVFAGVLLLGCLQTGRTGAKAESGKTATVSSVAYGGGVNVLVFTLEGTDYPVVDGGDASTYNHTVSYTRLVSSTFFDKVSVDGKTLREIYGSTDGGTLAYYINFWQQQNTFALHLPGYAADADVREIVVEKGCEFPAYAEENGYYSVADKLTFRKVGGIWTREIAVEYERETVEVTAISFGGWGLNYLVVTMEGSDYPDLYTEDKSLHNYKVAESKIADLNFFDKILLDGKTLRTVYLEHADVTYRDYVLNFFQYPGTFAFPVPGYASSDTIGEIVVQEGCEFPSYEYVRNGGTAKCLVTAEEKIGVKGTDSAYTLFSACDEEKPAVLDDSVTATVTTNGYLLSVRFNRTGEKPSEESAEDAIGGYVRINGRTLTEINREKKYVTATWSLRGGRYYLDLLVSPEAGIVVNEDAFFVGNVVGIDRDLPLPSGQKAEKDFLLHFYRTNSITEIVDEALREEKIFVENVSAGYDVNGDFNIWIAFSEEISAGLRQFLASPDSFGKTQLKPMNNPSLIYYDDDLAANFISGGYKSSLLDSVLINGRSVGDWLAVDSTPGYLSAVMVHYGQVNQKTMSIVCDLADDGSWATDVFTSASESYRQGGLTVTVKAGMRFPTGKKTETDAVYRYLDGKWKKQTGDFFVCYAGNRVGDGQTVTTAVKADKNNVFVSGDGVYEILETAGENVVRYAVLENGEQIFSFAVEEDIQTETDEKGCKSNVGARGTLYPVAIAAFAVLYGRRKKHA